MTVRAVVFDIGRVLIHWEPEAAYDRWIGEARRRALFEAVPLHDVNREIDRGAPFRATVAALAGAYPDWSEEITYWHDRWLEMASPRIDGSVALLEALLAEGRLPVYALTNFGTETFAIAQVHYPFLARFREAFVSGHLKMLKPDPGIYRAVEEGTGLANEQIFFTDDSLDNIAAARARGWISHHFDGPEGLARALARNGLLPEGTPT